MATVEMCHSRGGKTSQFIGKLLEILEDPNNSEIIKFDKRRRQLIVLSRKRLEEILPMYFKHSNFQSFARQLNWFGFHKVRNSLHHIFRHPELKRGKSICELKSKRKSSAHPSPRVSPCAGKGQVEGEFQNQLKINSALDPNVLTAPLNEPCFQPAGMYLMVYQPLQAPTLPLPAPGCFWYLGS